MKQKLLGDVGAAFDEIIDKLTEIKTLLMAEDGDDFANDRESVEYELELLIREIGGFY